MIKQEVMKAHGVGKLEKAECKKYAQTVTKDAWLAVVESAVDICLEKIPKFVPTFQKAFNVTQEQCDIKYTVFMDCIEFTMFSVSFGVFFIMMNHLKFCGMIF
jgi:hypothetical protein